MAGLNFTQAVWELGPATINAGESVEYAITYSSGESIVSYHTLNTDTALNQRFSYATTGIVISGPSEDTPPDSTRYFLAVTNDSDGTGEFYFFVNALYL